MRFTSLLFLSALAACGGAIETNLLDGGADASSGPDGSPSDASTKDSPIVVDTGVPLTCDDLANELTQETPSAEACCATCDIVQCTAQVDGLCCPITVNNANTNAVQAYEATLQQFRAAHCAVNCPAIACAQQPSGMCDPSGSCSQQ